MLSGLLWFLAGAVVGLVQVLALRWTVDSLRPDKPGNAMALVLGGTLLRAATVVVVLVIAIRQSLTLGLLAFAGFFVSRTLGVAILSSRMAHRERSSQ